MERNPVPELVSIVAIILSITSLFITIMTTVIVMYGRLAKIESDIIWMCRWMKIVYGPNKDKNR